jgi:hypothetical protein
MMDEPYQAKIDKLNSSSSMMMDEPYQAKIDKLNSSSSMMMDEPLAVNQEMESSLDTLFNVDNTWMSNDSKLNDTSSRKNKFDNNSIGDRIFSMSHFNKRPGYSPDFECELRKPLQGRDDKTI